ncbi:hypothetical protein L5515_007749 [Caenorhabditis briggsae]|uniref:Uncharacterized protein n=1 Tax=Caenorhabditis briggsae TaxID=6238 RepID=A0AAE9JMN0_CAEBR|nr:hypothetical protein L5515_007749 [Caenorhabditis briggsae]
MWRIGDLIGKQGESKEKAHLYDMTKIKGFPILKSSEGDVLYSDEGTKNKTNNTSWTIMEIARKMLGVDEIPTAREGNAIAQLLEELQKEKSPKNF